MIDRAIYVIGAMANDRVAGGDAGMPWHLPADLKRFRRLTWGHTVIMGRRTWMTMTEPLPGRQNIVLNGPGAKAEPGYPVAKAGSLSAAIELASEPDPIFVIGGYEPWAEAIHYARRVYLTSIHARCSGNVYFPELETGAWREVEREAHRAIVNGAPCAYDFVVYDRADPPVAWGPP